MSENVSIQEAGKSRNFSGVGALETETPEGDSCFWVPESERELETEYAIKNGTYRPKKYGFSDIHVNVFDLSTDLDGNDWKIDIGDINMPDISLLDFDIDLSLDLDGLPNIEFGIYIITVDNDEIKVELPGGEEIVIHGPSLTDPVVILDAIEISYDPSTGEWTVTALVECTVGDTTYNPGDVIKTWPGTEKVDFYIHAGVALPDLSEMIDLDAGFDVSLDVGDMGDISADISGIDLDGLDINISIDLDTLEVEEEYLPTSIKIITQPNKLEYKDGEPIDLTGMVVSAYYHDGTAVWANEDYPNGIIPLREFLSDVYHSKTTVCGHDLFEIDGQINKGNVGESASYKLQHNYAFDLGYFLWEYRDKKRTEAISALNGCQVVGLIYNSEEIEDRYASIYAIREYTEQRPTVNAYHVHAEEHIKGWKLNHPEEAEEWDEIVDETRDLGYDPYSRTEGLIRRDGNVLHYKRIGLYQPNPNNSNFSFDFKEAKGCFDRKASSWTSLNNFLYDVYYGDKDEVTCYSTVTLFWARPKDGEILSTSFDITVEESDNTTDGTGHYGGTTISGNYGGSHHSGKF